MTEGVFILLTHVAVEEIENMKQLTISIGVAIHMDPVIVEWTEGKRGLRKWRVEMLQEQAESVKDLAKPTVEALGVIGKKKCSECKGRKTKVLRTKKAITVSPCKTCNGTGKIGWKWEPKVGECFYGLSKVLHWIVNEKQCLQVTQHVEDHKLIPILHWEEIEKVLEEEGYWLEVNKPLNKYIKKGWMKVRARIYEDIAKNAAGNGEYVSCAEGNSCIRAVYKAVIALGKKP